MKGLLIKKLIMFRKSWLAIAILAVAFIAVGICTGEIQFTLILPLFMSIWSYSFVSMDEMSRWQQYSAVLPLERRVIVSSEYLSMLILNAISVVFVTVCSLIASIAGTTELTAGLLLTLILFAVIIGLIYPSLILPLSYKFSTEKSRIFLMFINGVMGGVSVMIVQGPVLVNAEYIPLIAFAVTAVLFVLSWLLSIRIYEKKDI